ncbi:enoyl-CoA hydratase/isomerase family protein [Nesterenkonia sp. E16_7]|uniref:enoyl-CoA hydratase-related protein n=1 Tax=unclassified Nesterenkonia TaxID=2629769 RepID=UPI001A91F0B5|nr:enoyl-CoA hydratase/isomerase family protein [Nesterenkonia sp. E16_10]MBO0598249.1 enoyl-CoA hydratase/isomerase family protein [Nesterenkonia sp. E16_7]
MPHQLPADTSARVHVQRAGAVAIVVLEDPSRRNVLGSRMRTELRSELAALAEDPTVRAVVLTGSGECFSSGGDLAAMPPADPAEGAARMEDLALLVRRLATLDKPVVAAVRGPAAGVAVGLVCCCDVVVIGTSARFLFPFTRLGLIPDGGLMHSLVRRVGAARAQKILLEAVPIADTEALAIGLADHIVTDQDVLSAAVARAEELASRAPLAVAAVKRGIREASSTYEEALFFEREQQPALFETSDFVEGKQALLHKRAPSFSGR